MIGSNQSPTYGNNGRNHCIALSVPNYLSAFSVIAQTGCIAIVPSRLAYLFAENFGLATAIVSDAPAPYNAWTLWHIRNERDARLMCIREQIGKVARTKYDV